LAAGPAVAAAATRPALATGPAFATNPAFATGAAFAASAATAVVTWRAVAAVATITARVVGCGTWSAGMNDGDAADGVGAGRSRDAHGRYGRSQKHARRAETDHGTVGNDVA
jgi:hypothetical protein